LNDEIIVRVPDRKMRFRIWFEGGNVKIRRYDEAAERWSSNAHVVDPKMYGRHFEVGNTAVSRGYGYSVNGLLPRQFALEVREVAGARFMVEIINNGGEDIVLSSTSIPKEVTPVPDAVVPVSKVQYHPPVKDTKRLIHRRGLGGKFSERKKISGTFTEFILVTAGKNDHRFRADVDGNEVTLTVVDSENVGLQVGPLYRGTLGEEIVAGRVQGNLTISDEALSSRHFSITVTATRTTGFYQFVFHDFDSRNGAIVVWAGPLTDEQQIAFDYNKRQLQSDVFKRRVARLAIGHQDASGMLPLEVYLDQDGNVVLDRERNIVAVTNQADAFYWINNLKARLERGELFAVPLLVDPTALAAGEAGALDTYQSQVQASVPAWIAYPWMVAVRRASLEVNGAMIPRLPTLPPSGPGTAPLARSARVGLERILDDMAPATSPAEEESAPVQSVGPRIVEMSVDSFEALDDLDQEGDGAQSTANTGGVDFNPDQWKIETQGKGVDIKLPADLSNFQNPFFEGFEPVIIQIQPLPSLPAFLGQSEPEKQDRLSLKD
ncbi:MAG: hypothetical protein NUV91_03370, partial [Candidatus Omnitrophica bacterium]|nr:hypothetical protein [Candidatus Omnitrophota bacterium]